MSDNKIDRIFVDGLWASEKKFDNGGSILKVSLLVEKFAPFVKKHKNKSGYINIIIAPKKNPDDKSTHFSYLDTWEPNKNKTTTPKTSPVPQKVEDSTDF